MAVVIIGCDAEEMWCDVLMLTEWCDPTDDMLSAWGCWTEDLESTRVSQESETFTTKTKVIIPFATSEDWHIRLVIASELLLLLSTRHARFAVFSAGFIILLLLLFLLFLATTFDQAVAD